MPEKSGDPFILLLLYVLGGIMGGLGGCSVAATLYIKGVPLRPQLILAYTVVAIFFGLVCLVAAVSIYGVQLSIENAIMHGGGWGAAIAFVLSGANVTIKMVSKKFFGKEFVLEVKDVKEVNKNDE